MKRRTLSPSELIDNLTRQVEALEKANRLIHGELDTAMTVTATCTKDVRRLEAKVKARALVNTQMVQDIDTLEESVEKQGEAISTVLKAMINLEGKPKKPTRTKK